MREHELEQVIEYCEGHLASGYSQPAVKYSADIDANGVRTPLSAVKTRL